jgi:hypothetical protein
MSAEREIDALLIRNLDQIEQALHRLHFSLEPEIFRILDETVRKSTVRKGWDGEFDWNGEGSFWFWPKRWKTVVKSKVAHLGYFELNSEHQDDNLDIAEIPPRNQFALSRLCQVNGNGSLGFRWQSEHFSQSGKLLAWRKFVQANADSITSKTKFRLEDKRGSFFLPIKIEAEILATALENDVIEDALQPFRDALDEVIRSAAVFDSLIKKAMAHPPK